MARKKYPVTFICKHCGKTINAMRPNNTQPVYCSQSCAANGSRKPKFGNKFGEKHLIVSTNETLYQYLYRLYVIEQTPEYKICRMLGVSTSTVKRRMLSLGIPIRTSQEALQLSWDNDDGTRAKASSTWMKKLNSEIMIGENHPRYAEKLEMTCKECGKIFYRTQAYLDAKEGMGNFCGFSCAAINRKRLMRHNSPTAIEKALKDILDERKLDYKFNYYLKPWVIDFAFLDARLAVEADGIYWHSLPGMIEKDARKDADLASRNWQILRFDGNRIRADATGCVQEIVSFLGQ